MPPHHQHPSALVRLLFITVRKRSRTGRWRAAGWISQQRSWRDKTAPSWDERRENAVERHFCAVFGAFRPVASRMQRAKKLISSKTKARVATSNPQRSLLCNRPHGYETAQRSTARHDRRRHRPSGPRASAIWPSLAGRARRRYAPGGDVLRTCRELHACAGKPTTNWLSLVMLNATYWYVWALFTPSIVWLSQHFRFERQGLVRAILVHVPSVALFSFAHIAGMAGAQWWLFSTHSDPWWAEVKRSALMNFDWEMMTYWAIAGPQSCRSLLPRVTRPRARGMLCLTSPQIRRQVDDLAHVDGVRLQGDILTIQGTLRSDVDQCVSTRSSGR